MLRIAIVDQGGKEWLLKDVSTATELWDVARQARNVIQDVERLAQLKKPTRPVSKPRGTTPYL